MEWNDIWKIVLGVVAGFGGISGIIILVIKFASNMIATRLQEKYTLQLNKELEKYKSALDSKTYISKTKFDAEFEIYRRLSTDFCDAVRDISIMIPILGSNPIDLEERKKHDIEIYNRAVESVTKAQNALYGNTPFIPAELADMYSEILKLCNMQFTAFSRRWSASYLGTYEEKCNMEHEVYDTTREINDKFKITSAFVRDYLAKLDVIE